MQPGRTRLFQIGWEVIINLYILGNFNKKNTIAYIKKEVYIISKLKERGAEGIIGGCTEISILIKQSDCDILIFDTAKIHSEAGVEYVTGS